MTNFSEKSPYNPENIFAKIIRGELPCEKICENQHAIAFHDVAPKAPIHILVIPKGHYRDQQDFHQSASDDEICAFYRLVAQATTRTVGTAPEGHRLIANSGPHAGQEVPHFHLHILAGEPLGPMRAHDKGRARRAGLLPP